ncbi:MAG: extracellular solute-binding protein [Oscillospiraceae bacterium]|nr:extracellular solute-binding protein [Oscillospiraceae bacterium]
MLKKMLALALALVLALSLVSCTGGGNKTVGEATTEPLTKDDVVSIYVISHPTWSFKEDWKVWEYIKENVGCTLEVTGVPGAEAPTKWALMFAAPDTLPDILTYDHKPSTDTHALSGAIMSFDSQIEYMPNYKKWVDSLSEEDYNTFVNTHKSFDGEVYYPPVQGRELQECVRAWLYRKDIFEKHNLEIPETFDELYEVSKKLKELYPDSYPFCIRSGVGTTKVLGSSFKEYWEPEYYYDYNNEKWSYGATEDTMLEVITFYKKMVAEGLMPSNFITIPTSEWQSLVSTDRGFIFPDYMTRIDNFNSVVRQSNPEFTVSAMMPPVANAETGVAKVAKQNYDALGMVICNTRDEKRIANAAKYIDWFYTEEARQIVSWGKEGETYEVVDGKKQYIKDAAGNTPKFLYGFGTHGTFTLLDPEAIASGDSKEINEVREMVLDYSVPYMNPTNYLAVNNEEQKVLDEYYVAIQNYTQEMFTKMVLGQEPLSIFDEYKETLVEMGVNEVLAAYESAYARVK